MSNQAKVDIYHILDEGDKWLNYLIRQRIYMVIENSVIALIVYSMLFLIISSGSDLTSSELLVRWAFLAIPFTIISLYFFYKRRRIGEFENWKTYIAELRNYETAPVQSTEISEETPYKGTLESALELMDQMTLWIQEITESRIDWALGYGVLAFFLSETIFMSYLVRVLPSNRYFLVIPSSIAVGGLVWYVIRERRRYEAERRIKMLRNWKSRLEKEGNEFLESF